MLASEPPQAETQSWTDEMKSGDGQKHEISELDEQESAFCIQVLKHRGRTSGHPASGIGVSLDDNAVVDELVARVVLLRVVKPPVGFFTHFPSLNSSSPWQVTAEVVVADVVATGVLLLDVTPPVGFLTHLPSLNSSSSLQEGAEVEEVVATGVLLGVVLDVTPPVGFLTHLPSFVSSSSLQTTVEVVV